MPKYRFFSTAEAARILKTSRNTVDNWLRSGFVDPIRRGLSRKEAHILDESALFALAVGRACRQRKMSLAAAGAVMQFVADAGLDKLREEFNNGRCFLTVVGTQTADVLLTREDAFAPLSPSVQQMVGPFVPIINVDLGECFQAFEKEVTALVVERDAAHAARAGA